MKSGFVAVVGRPNVGKSTLVNALVGSKVVITSPRPQTTRNVVRGVVTVTEEPEFQAVLVDTPGLHKPRNALGERLNRLVYGTLAEADAVVFLIDATAPVGPGDRLIAERLAKAGSPVIVVVNKTDAARKGQIPERLAEAAAWGFAAYVPVSALHGEGLESILSELGKLLPEGPRYYPADAVTDQPESFLAGELIREKFLARLRDELPHSLVVDVREIEQRPDGSVYVDARIIVERTSQKGIVIGKGGLLLRDAGSEARTELERLFGARVYLDLRVRVEKNWQRKPQMLDRFGFGK
ncbi:GTPase Era [bacterium BMS3Abin02]|nr:GTPase Era [bacterium BMS3Abin02]GBE21898.1 GTPase Era [bacterium BMS3Bbin01]HDH25396.1 GTPase Era [Actinomycetota bacterium]HDK44814.1 GTPase Era [Actinomycetota bacterium]HDL49573.1 GTPase Era [Actinomycetota bacterium]